MGVFCSCVFFVLALRAATQDFGFWIGLRDVTGNNMDWKWERDGDNLTDANWIPTQPSGPTQRCVDVLAVPMFGGAVGQWDDDFCTAPRGAVCEADRVGKVSSWNKLASITYVK